MSEWPEKYNLRETPDRANVGYPSWSRVQTLEAGKALADRIHADPVFANGYLQIVKKYHADRGEYLSEYAVFVRDVYPSGDMDTFNASDYANIHHAAWLFLLEPFACLVDHNPHGDWGNPPLDSITRGDERTPTDDNRNFHNIPNKTGYYAISTVDIPPPQL